MRVQDEAERLEAMEGAVQRLREAARGSVVLVEGERDVQALRRMEVGGHHVRVNRGVPLEEVMDALVRRVRDGRLRQVVLLVDWDRTGGRLFTRLHEGLKARVAVDGECRRFLATACHVRSLEEVPAEMAALRLRLGRGA